MSGEPSTCKKKIEPRSKSSKVVGLISVASAQREQLLKDRRLLFSYGYYVGQKIDSGTFATVRYAEKRSMNGTEPLAVKIIDKAKASPLLRKKFLQRELNIWPKLRHPHIIQVNHIFSIQDRIYVFMELASKGSVIEYLQRHGAVEEGLAQKWCQRMCEALRYCHGKGVAHRDLKCDNLLLDGNLELKIGDFGFSCRCYNPVVQDFLYSETYCGSSSYVAPEVIKSRPYDPIAADVWSAGVCIYVILNNRMPFNDSNITKMYIDQVKRKWDFVPELAPKLSPAAKKLITRMLEPHPKQRPTMEQVLNSSWMRMK